MGIAYAIKKEYNKASECFQLAAKLGIKEAQDFLRENNKSW